jgi:plasmid stabilization system protein ParE
MPQLIFASQAIRDLQRLRDFLHSKNPDAARRAAVAIRQGLRLLADHPRAGRLIEGLPDTFREWLIEFGDSGYIARYRVSDEVVTILIIRHQRETDVQPP